MRNLICFVFVAVGFASLSMAQCAGSGCPGTGGGGGGGGGGNATTATALQTPRMINGTAFDGTQDIVLLNAFNVIASSAEPSCLVAEIGKKIWMDTTITTDIHMNVCGRKDGIITWVQIF